MEVAHDLRDRAFDPEKLVGEKVINLDRLVFVKPLGARIVSIVNVARAV